MFSWGLSNFKLLLCGLNVLYNLSEGLALPVGVNDIPSRSGCVPVCEHFAF